MSEIINPNTAGQETLDATGNFTFTFKGDTADFSSVSSSIKPLSTHILTLPTQGGITISTDLETGTGTVTDVLGFPPAVEFQVGTFAISGENSALHGYQFDKSLGPIPLTSIGINGFVDLPIFDGKNILAFVEETISNVTFTSAVSGLAAVPEPNTAFILLVGVAGIPLVRYLKKET
jgi:hypothetical protein